MSPDSAKTGASRLSDRDRLEITAWLRDEILASLSPRPRSIAIFGSFAAGTLHEASDIDLLLAGDRIPRKPYERSRWFFPIHEKWQNLRISRFPFAPRTLSPLILSEKGWLESIGLRLSLSGCTWTLYDDGWLSTSLNESEEWIRKGLWHKETLKHGGWVWIPSGDAA